MKKRRSGLKIMLSLLGLLGKLKYIIIFAVFGGCLGNACAISVMTFGACSVAKLVDPDFTTLSLGTLIALTILAGILRGLLRFLEQYNNHYIAFKLLASLRDRIFGQLRKLAPARLEGKQKGALISMLTSDVETLEVFYAHTISPILIALIVDGAVAILVSLLASPWLGLVAFLAYLVIGILVPFLSSAWLKNEGMEYRRQFADSSSYFLDSVKGITDIVLNGNAAVRSKELDRQSDYMNKKTVAIKEKSSRVGAFSNLFVSLSVLTAVLVGSLLIHEGSCTVSEVIVAVVMLSSSFGPVLSLASLPANLTQTFASGDRILDFMEEKPVVEENFSGKDFAFEGVKVENLSFSYEEKEVLKDVDLEVKKGEILGIRGESGCGKSTLLKLLLRFYDPKAGRIVYGNTDLKDCNAEALHKNVVLISQDTYLFDTTIAENLRVARKDASLEEIREACRKASVDDFISSLPNGYDTEVGLLGDSLSAGEKQRIGLARAFLSGAPLILLDEVTSNVDAINEGIILSSLKRAAGDLTIILVSHRASTMKACTRVLNMKNGSLQNG